MPDWRQSIVDQAVRDAGAVPGAPVSVLKTSVTLSSSDLLALLATPVTLLAAPGVGFLYQALFALLEYNPVSVDYTLGAVVNFFIGPDGSPTVLNVLQPVSATLVNGLSGPGQVVAVSPSTNVVLANKASFENKPLVITHDGGVELLNGNGTVMVTIYYICTSC